MHEPLPPFAATSGPKRAKILVIGEAWGKTEQELRKPLVGESGKEFFRMLGDAVPEWASLESYYEMMKLARYEGGMWHRARERFLEDISMCLTNVFALRPAANNLLSICLPGGKKDLPAGYPSYPHLEPKKHKYLIPEYFTELERLGKEIEEVQPNLILLLGNTALWALNKQQNIGSVRGTIGRAQALAPGVKVLPTYHPAGVLRNWSWRTIVVVDLMKASREMAFAEIRRPRREILVNPTIDEVEQWTSKTLAERPKYLASDTETFGGQIEMISFAPSRSSGIVIPFLDRKKPGWSYWPEPGLEERAWSCAARLLESSIPKIWQNGMYDFQYILPMHIRLVNCTHDAMLLHHSIYPEMLKGLGFLGSIYGNEPAWKLMRTHKPDTEKRDE